MKKIIVIFLALIFFQQKTSAQFPQASIAGTVVRKITSAVVAGQEYELRIMLPGGYASGNKTYPVLYLMDAQWDFPLATALYGEQYYDGFIPEMIIVGISWGGDHPNPDSLRARDYTPTTEKRLPQSGGADAFLSFMKKELFPFIEANYRADSKNRILMGCSLGGLFTLYALFTQPELFRGYVAASPAFGWDNGVLYQFEKKYHDNATRPDGKLFMCMGGVERAVPGFEKFTQQLSDRHYPSLKIQTRILENTGHSGTKAEGFARGLQYVFERPSLQFPDDKLKKYTGSYSSAGGESAEIKLEDKKLVLYSGGNNKFILHAMNETDFYSTAEFLNVHFKKDDHENITGFQLDRFGSTVFISKNK